MLPDIIFPEQSKILKKAQSILKQKEHRQTCLKAGICPLCGEATITKRFCESEGCVIVTGCSSCHKL